MRPYVAVLGARLRTLLQYRAAALAGFGTQLFWGLIRTMIFSAFYASASRTPPMSLRDVVAYVWLGQAFFALFPLRTDGDVTRMIRNGNVAYELVRPVGLYSLWYARAIANRVAPTVLRALPLLTIAGIAGWIPWTGWRGLGVAAVALGIAVLLSAAIEALMTVSLLWTISGDGVSRILPIVAMVCSGMYLPLPLFPDRLGAVLRALPFRALIDVPFRLYLGDLPSAEAPILLAQELAWVLVFVLAGRALVARGVARAVVQGG